jgi:hypothetical protein
MADAGVAFGTLKAAANRSRGRAQAGLDAEKMVTGKELSQMSEAELAHLMKSWGVPHKDYPTADGGRAIGY